MNSTKLRQGFNVSRLVNSYKRLYPFASVCKRIIYCLSLGYDRGKKMFGLRHPAAWPC